MADDIYFKRKGLDDFLKRAQNVGSLDELSEMIETHPKVIQPKELMGHLLLESSGAKEDDPRLLGKIRDMMYKDTDISPADIQIDKTIGPKELTDDSLGHYNKEKKNIIIKVNANPLQKASTLGHEIGHHMDDVSGLKSIPVKEFPEEKIVSFIKNNPNATDLDMEKFIKSVKDYGLEGDAVASLAPAKAKELKVTMHHEGKPRGFEMEQVYDIVKGAGKKAKAIGKGITKIGVKSLPVVGAVAGLAEGDASAAIPGMWSESVGEGSDDVPQLNREEESRFKILKEKLESQE